MSDINTILINAGVSSGIFILYKIINHYRLRSECNQNNQLVISVVDIEKPDKPEQEMKEISPQVVITKPS